MQTVKVDSEHITIRRRYRDPHRFVGANYKKFGRRDYKIAGKISAMNPANPLMQPWKY